MKLSRVLYTSLFLLTFSFSFSISGYAQVTETYCSTDVPVGIIDETTVTSDLILLDAAEIQDIVVKLQLVHSFRADVEVSLTSPDNTTILLFADVGSFEDDFGDQCQPMPNFILDDSAAEPVSDFGSADPPAGTYRPEDPLSTFMGEDQFGQWTLSIFDDADGDEGTLNCWCLEITRAHDVVRSIPTISQWGTIALTVVLGASAVLYLMLRRRKQAV